MNGILTIPEKEVSLELKDLTVVQFRMIERKADDKIPMGFNHEPIGETIILITSNMPEPLKDKVIQLINEYRKPIF